VLRETFQAGQDCQTRFHPKISSVRIWNALPNELYGIKVHGNKERLVGCLPSQDLSLSLLILNMSVFFAARVKPALPECWGHRGASAAFPENTLLSFKAAIADGAHAIESGNTA